MWKHKSRWERLRLLFRYKNKLRKVGLTANEATELMQLKMEQRMKKRV